ncbi:MAG: hypothetical protein IRZ07_18865 [Microbispora sp.]|nr:hypothetical protein [Microbispora sp.]
MKYVRPALAALALVLVAGCGGPVTAEEVVQSLRDAGYPCDPGEERIGQNENPDISFKCGGAWAYAVYDSDQLRSDLTIEWEKMTSEATSRDWALADTEADRSVMMFYDPDNTEPDYPFWELLCMDKGCISAAKSLGYRS